MMRKFVMWFAAALAAAFALSACGTPALTLEQQIASHGSNVQFLGYTLTDEKPNPFVDTSTEKSVKAKKKWNSKKKKWETAKTTTTTSETEIEAAVTLNGCRFELDRKANDFTTVKVRGQDIVIFTLEVETDTFELEFDERRAYTPADAIAVAREGINALPPSERPSCFLP